MCPLTVGGGGGGPAPFAASHVIGGKDKRTNNRTMRLGTKNHGAASYLGPVKIVLRTSAGLV